MRNHNIISSEIKLSILSSNQKKCISIFKFFQDNLKLYPLEQADIIICLGGDGFMLHTLHNTITLNKPIYGINCGCLGFLMNDFNPEESIEIFLNKLNNEIKAIKVYPLEVNFTNNEGKSFTSLAFNEASLLRKDGIASHLKIYLNDQLKCKHLVSDGALISTPLGSLAYNRACGGPIIPLDSKLLILTTINPFEPSHFHGCILGESSVINIEVINSNIRKVNLFCDFIKYKNISKITVKKSKTKFVNLLFNKQNHLEEKVSNIQFTR